MRKLFLFLTLCSVTIAALSRKTVIDRVEVLESGFVQVREARRIIDTKMVDGKEVEEIVSQKFHRRIIQPGEPMDEKLTQRMSVINLKNLTDNNTLKSENVALKAQIADLQAQVAALQAQIMEMLQ